MSTNSPKAALGAIAALAIWATAPASAVEITIVNKNNPNEGFNDPTRAEPVGGNYGTTVGQQRLIAFQYAASIWGAALNGTVSLRIESSFVPLTCSQSSGVLGATSPNSAIANFPNSPRPDVWYPVALAEELAGRAYPGNPIRTMFNSNLGSPTCLSGNSWYYGLDGKSRASQFDLVAVALHEFAHGLGFVTLTDTQTGQQLKDDAAGVPRPDIWEFNMFDLVLNKHWNDMTDDERRASAINPRKLVWDGPNMTEAAPGVLPYGRPSLTVQSPPTVAGEYLVGTAQFGPQLTTSGVSGTLQDAASTGCTPPLPPALSGKIALLDRGDCTFVDKVKNAQSAGALAVVIADSEQGSPPPEMGGAGPTITIPAVIISLADGQKIRAALVPGPVTVSERLLPGYRGADDNNRVLLYTPDSYKYSPGSSVSHTDTVSTLLMDPSYNKQGHDLDLTPYLLKDIGWSIADPNPKVSPPTPPKSSGGCTAAPGAMDLTITVVLLLVGIWFAARSNQAGRPQSTSSHPRWTAARLSRRSGFTATGLPTASSTGKSE